MRNLFGRLLVTLTLMVSGMTFYVNIGNMLYGDSLSLLSSIASGMFLLVWIALSVYSMANRGVYSPFINFYWFVALLGAAFCVITISGITRVLEYAAYLLLFFLTPLLGLRLYPMTHLAWSMVMAGIAFCFAVLATLASNRRADAPAGEDSESDIRDESNAESVVDMLPQTEAPTPDTEDSADAEYADTGEPAEMIGWAAQDEEDTAGEWEHVL